MANYNADGVRAKTNEMIMTKWSTLTAAQKQAIITAMGANGIGIIMITRRAVILDPDYNFADFTTADFERDIKRELCKNPLYEVWVAVNIPEQDRSYYC